MVRHALPGKSDGVSIMMSLRLLGAPPTAHGLRRHKPLKANAMRGIRAIDPQ
jgi:hypothetical protein